MGPADDLADEWWAASEEFRRDDFWWHKADSALSDVDPRVLILGPGERHPKRPLTEAAENFLTRAGFAVEMPGSTPDLDAHRQHVSGFPRIAALPMSIGSAAEVLDLLTQGSQPHIGIVLPREDSDSYFARLLAEKTSTRVICENVDENSEEGIDPKLGRRLLEAIGKFVVAEAQANHARYETEHAPGESSVQAKLAARTDADQHPGWVRALGPFSALIAILTALAVVLAAIGVALPVVGAVAGAALGLLGVTLAGERVKPWYWRLPVVLLAAAMGAGVASLADDRDEDPPAMEQRK